MIKNINLFRFTWSKNSTCNIISLWWYWKLNLIMKWSVNVENTWKYFSNFHNYLNTDSYITLLCNTITTHYYITQYSTCITVLSHSTCNVIVFYSTLLQYTTTVHNVMITLQCYHPCTFTWHCVPERNNMFVGMSESWIKLIKMEDMMAETHSTQKTWMSHLGVSHHYN